MSAEGRRSAAWRLAKGVRDGVAKAMASAAARWEPAERALTGAGRTLHGRSRTFDQLYHHAVDTLAERRRAGASPVFRRMRLGPVRVWGEVTHFSFGSTWYHRCGYEPKTVEIFARVLAPGATCVDVGANHGYFTVLAARLVGPTGRVEAFEPNPAVAEALDRVLARNGLADGVSVHRVALSDRVGHADLYLSVSPVNDGLSSLLAPDDAPMIRRDHSIRIPTETFDGFAERVGLGRVDLLKIDVEGAEAMVLRGMARTLAARPPLRIVCETDAGGEAERLLRTHGYAVEPLDTPRGRPGNVLFTAPHAA